MCSPATGLQNRKCEAGAAYIDYYSKSGAPVYGRAYKLFGIKDAIHIPTMMAPDGTGAASINYYWNTLLGPELLWRWIFTWFYEYSREEDTLRIRFISLLKDYSHLYQKLL